MERKSTHESAEIISFAVNPPEVILVFDNYRGKDLKSDCLANRTMAIRAAVAASVYHSFLYGDNNRPIVCSFAGEHEGGDIAGSQKVAAYLRNFKIPADKISLRKNTITTTTDLMQLHAFMAARGFKKAAIVTTDDNVSRTKLEIDNHFRRGKKHRIKPDIYVISPSSEIVKWMKDVYPNVASNFSDELVKYRLVGSLQDLNGGLTEKIAIGIARIPFRPLRLPIQRLAENASHSHTPVELVRVQRASKRLAP